LKSTHQIFFNTAQKMKSIKSNTIALMVTSPPYPMIEMWDDCFIAQDQKIATLIKSNQGMKAFNQMHVILDQVWKEVYRVLIPGGLVCINIGDATRTVGNQFSLYVNHARILSSLLSIGFNTLPDILWRKQTNAPNKFMGSGMYPPGAYVTLEHEFILIARKGGLRLFNQLSDKTNRRESAYFWEERNNWFSDVWMDIKGAQQRLFDKNVRERSGAFPFSVPYRLINMYSVKGDTILDPFLGLGTTMLAAMTSGRNSIGFEIEEGLKESILLAAQSIQPFANEQIHDRLMKHTQFVTERLNNNKPLKHKNIHYGFPVITKQESELLLNDLSSVNVDDDRNEVIVTYETVPQKQFIQ